MSAGLPCIVTDCMTWRGEDQFIIDRVNGLKIPINDSVAMANAIDELISSEKLISSLAKEALKIRERFDLKRIITSYKKAIDI